MARFAVGRGAFGTYETVVLADAETGATAAFARLGGTLLAWRVPVAGNLFDVTDGFATPEELAEQKGGRAWIMAPWSNRIDGGRYAWGGADHDLGLEDPKNRVILHGFVKKIVCDVAREAADDASARVTFATRAIRRGAFRGYPFDVDVAVTYALGGRRLDIEVVGRNVGPETAPFGCGWHPYFRTPTPGIGRFHLAIPCGTKIATDARLLPLAGDAAYVPIEQAAGLDFRPGRPGDGNVVGKRVLDAAFADLEADADGWCRTWIEDPGCGLRITVFQERGLMHVFTGDTLGRRPRGALALEPVEFMTNAFNRPECREVLALAPGAERSFRFGVEVGEG